MDIGAVHQKCWQEHLHVMLKMYLGFKSDYLIAHADCYVFEYENQGYSAIPQGEEREILNELFDQLFFRLKTDGFLHPKKEVVEERRQSVIESAVYLTELASESTGQLYFLLMKQSLLLGALFFLCKKKRIKKIEVYTEKNIIFLEEYMLERRQGIFYPK